MEKKSDGKSARINSGHEYIKLLLVLLIIFLIVFVFILYISWPLMTGKRIVLAMAPVDPFDMFRGQYLQINYQISTISEIQDAKYGDAVFVKLQQDNSGIWRYQSASLSMPSDDSIFIKGTIANNWGNQLRVEYGIEQYFFERNAQFSMQNLTVEARVSSSGQARIVQILQNGKPLEIQYKNITLTS